MRAVKSIDIYNTHIAIVQLIENFMTHLRKY